MLRLLSLSALFVSTSSFFFGNTGCGCPTAPMCLPMPMCAPPAPPACAPAPSCGGAPASYAVAAPAFIAAPAGYPGPSYGPPPPPPPPQPLPQSPIYQPPPPQPQALPPPQVYAEQPGPSYQGSAPVPQQAPSGSYVPAETQADAQPQQQSVQEVPVNAQRDVEQDPTNIENKIQQEAVAAGQTNEEVIEEGNTAAPENGFSEAPPADGSTPTPDAVEERVVDIATLNLTDDPLCNSEDLRKLMLENIDENLNNSKRLIQLAAEAQFGGRFDVICANGDFSYVTNTELFCQETKGDISCYTYRQL